MSNCNIEIPTALYERLKALAGKQGYSSAEEMILHILEKAADGGLSGDLSGEALVKTEALAKAGTLSAADEAKTESIKRQLKGLGYFNG